MKGYKRDGVKHSQAKGVYAAAETGPLFPRLHVNETEKAGPKAPPRNKMALYEQFTVPSHRFEQANQALSTVTCQQKQVQYGSDEYRYSYLPYYIPPVPYASSNSGIQVYAQPSHTASSSGISAGSGVVSDEGQQKVTKHHHKVSPSKGSRRRPTEAAADSLTRVLPGQKGKDAGILHVSTSSARRNSIKQNRKLLQSVPYCTEKSSTLITDITPETLSSVEPGLEHSVPDGRVCINELVDTRKCHMTDEVQPKQASRESDTNMLDEWGKQSSAGHTCLQSECGPGSICEDLSAPANVITGNGICTMDKAFHHCVQLLEGHTVIDSQTLVAKGRPSDGVQGNGIGCSMGNALSEPECTRIEGRSTAEFQKTQPKTILGGSNESSFSDSTIEIKPKDVIHAIGQQQFWKARKTLLRQQRIFSDQVFQLHKLMKVQQLLAETPGTLIDEEMHFETIEECVAAVSAPAKDSTHLGARADKATCDPKEGSKGKAAEGGSQPGGIIQDHGHIQAGAKDRGRAQQFVEELGGGSGVSAWGYPSLGPWMGPMGAQGQPFVCQPFARTFPPEFGLPYGSAMPGSIPPMLSAGIPYYDQRQPLATEMGSNFASSMVYKHAGRSGGDSSGRNSSHMMSNDLSGSWYFMQHNGLNGQRVPATGSDKDIPTGSGGSVNKSPAAVRSVATPYFPAAWVSTGQEGVVNTDGLESSGHQSETSSPSVGTKPHGHVLYIPAASASRKLGFNHSYSGDVIHTPNLASAHTSDNRDQYVCCTNAIQRREADPGTQGDVIGQKEGGIALDVGTLEDNEEVSGHTPNTHALDLFPLVPSLSSSGLVHSSRETQPGQGRVIRAVPRRAVAASESAAGILLSLRRERQK